MEDLNVSEQIQQDAEREVKDLSSVDKANLKIEEATDPYNNKKIKYVPNTNFTDCNSSGTLLPINMASETINNLSRLSKKENLTEFVQRELGYNTKAQVCMSFSSEQVEALAMIITQIKLGKGFILGDMAGVGKGRVIAGVQRYCIKNGIIPVFITAMPNLFSEMHKDVLDIHGFGELKIDKFVQPSAFIYNDRTDIEAVIRDGEGREIPGTELMSKEEIKEICEKGKMPKGKNCIWLSYSQISNTKANTAGINVKQKFLVDLAPKAVFILDESHEAAGKETGVLGAWARQVVSLAKGVTFASATYAKRPEAFGVYAIRTALSESQIPIADLEKALDIGGENVSEYIASAMVAEGQMIRRERSYGECEIKTVYKDENTQLDVAKKQVYDTFDNSTNHFRELTKYIRTQSFKGAVNNAIYRAANTESRKRKIDIELVDFKDWNKSASAITGGGDKDSRDARTLDYLQNNAGKYVPMFSYDTIGSGSRKEFSENLFLALKAKLTADTVIAELRDRKEYKYKGNEGEYNVKTNRKPIIAIRKTQAAIINVLAEEVGVGGIVQNDFAEYVHLLTRKCYKGKVTFIKVCPEFFDAKLRAKTKNKITIPEVKFTLLDSDFDDNGVAINDIRNRMANFQSGLPLSFIDYVRERIQAGGIKKNGEDVEDSDEFPKGVRASWDTIIPGDSSTANLSKTYVFGEITGRGIMLVRSAEGWTVELRERPSTKVQFNEFNRGNIDVLLINESGAVGQSAHSSERFYDKRPRIMYIAESELDVNTEVQKRGRIFRTGQVNMPAYTYIVSLVPAEIRRIIALRSKLRKLDANISANQTQSSEMADIKDRDGNPIEDIYNKYGIEAFNEDFIPDPLNTVYKVLYEDVTCRGNFSFIDKSDVEKLIKFGRLLDMEVSDIQETFYDQMNLRYRKVVASHKPETGDGTYQLELETENFKAALKSRAVVALGLGTSEFSQPLFLEDKYTLEVRKTLTKEKVEAKITELCADLNGITNPDKCHEKFIEDFQKGYDVYIQYVENLITESAPKVENYDGDIEKFEDKLDIFNKSMAMRISALKAKKDDLSIVSTKMRGRVSENDKGLLDFFVPGRGVVIEDWLIGWKEEWDNADNAVAEELADNAADTAPKKTTAQMEAEIRDRLQGDKPTEYITARFLGYKLVPVSKTNPYSDGSIELHFALLDGTPPVLILKPSKNIRALKKIKQTTIRLYSRTDYNFKDRNDAWSFNAHQRNVRRFLSGNILAGIVRANEMSLREVNMDKKKIIKDWGLVRYTNYDGSVSTGITLYYKNDRFVKNNDLFAVTSNGKSTSQTPVTIPPVHDKLMDYLKLVPASWSDKSADLYNSVIPIDKGLIRLVRPKDASDCFELQVGSHATVKNKGGKNLPSVTKANEFYNPYYFDTNFDSIITDRYLRGSASNNLYGQVYSKGGTLVLKELAMKRYNFRFDNANDIAKFKSAMKYIWDKDKYMAIFPASKTEAYVAVNLADTYNPKSKSNKTEHLFPVGDYKYNRLANKDDSPSIPASTLVDEGDGGNGNGTVTLSFPLPSEQALAFKIYPPALASDIAVKLFFAAFDEHARAKINSDLDKAVKEGMSNYDLGELIEKESSYKIANLLYIFGDRSTSQIGELFKTFSEKGDLSKIVFEVKEEVVAKPEVEKTKVVDFSGAENYLISMMA